MKETGIIITVPGAFTHRQNDALQKHGFCVLGYDFGNRVWSGAEDEKAMGHAQLMVDDVFQIQGSFAEPRRLKVIAIQKGNRDPRYALRTNDCFICVSC
jgi:hypothetical protein